MSKLKFKGKTIYTKTCVDNILHSYAVGDLDDKLWYHDAYLFAYEMAVKHGVCVEKAVGVLAALSPQKSWDENKRLTDKFLQGHKYGHFGFLIDKSQFILDSNGSAESIVDILNGDKIKAFFLNILFHKQATVVTVDRHAIEIALGTVLDNHSLTKNQYQFFSNCYVIAANYAGVKPHEIQAVTWVQWRKAKDAKKYEDVPF